MLLRKRAELDANLYDEFARRQQNQQLVSNVTHDGGEEQLPVWEGFNVSEMFDEHGHLKETTPTADQLELDRYIDHLVEEQRREEEAEANQTRSNAGGKVDVEQRIPYGSMLIDPLRNRWHRRAPYRRNFEHWAQGICVSVVRGFAE